MNAAVRALGDIITPHSPDASCRAGPGEGQPALRNSIHTVAMVAAWLDYLSYSTQLKSTSYIIALSTGNRAINTPCRILHQILRNSATKLANSATKSANSSTLKY